MSDPNAELPQDITRHTFHHPGGRSVTMTVGEIIPPGTPNPNKTGDSIQANYASRVASMKKNEKRIPADRPAVLIADFAHFGAWPLADKATADEAMPVYQSLAGPVSGGIWNGLYGWQRAPLFEGDHRRYVLMAHEGRFRVPRCKLSAVLVVWAKTDVLLENPWATHRRLSDPARRAFIAYASFDAQNSVLDTKPADALNIVQQQVAQINALQGSWRLKPDF